MMSGIQKLGLLVLSLFALSVSAADLTDGEIAKILVDANNNEIAAARTALKKSARQEVKDFADKMIKDHNDNKDKVQTIARNEGWDLDKSMKDLGVKTRGLATSTELAVKSGKAFDRGYMDGQVEMHRNLLRDLDNTYIPQAKNNDFRDYLKQTRSDVKAHLDEAEKIASALK